MNTAKMIVSCMMVAMLACGGDEVAGLNIDRSKAINELTTTEIEALCDYASAKVSTETKEFFCTVVGIQSEFMGANCDQERSECLAQAPQRDECRTDTRALENCGGATVGDYTQCVDDYVDAITALTSSLSCDTSLFGLPQLDPNTLASCATIKTECEAFMPGFDDDSL